MNGVPGGGAARPPISTQVSIPAELLLARAYLSRVAEAPASALSRLVDDLGPVEAAARVRSGRVPEPVAAETGARRAVDRAEADLEAAAAVGGHGCSPRSTRTGRAGRSSPSRAARARVSSPRRWRCGCAAPAGSPSCASGRSRWSGPARRPATAQHMAGELATGLADRGVTVVSGAAIGIDGAAHRGALAVDGPTVAVLACGVDRAYPAVHERLLERIAARPGWCSASTRRAACRPGTGSWSATGSSPGWPRARVVVEAGLRSGAQRTAADARALGRVRDGAARAGHLRDCRPAATG